MSDVLFFVSVATAIAGQLSDIVTTDRGLSTGGKELNSVVAYAINKIGFSAVAFIKIVGLAIGLPVLFLEVGQPLVGVIVAFASAGVGFYAGIANYIALKKAKISL